MRRCAEREGREKQSKQSVGRRKIRVRVKLVQRRSPSRAISSQISLELVAPRDHAGSQEQRWETARVAESAARGRSHLQQVQRCRQLLVKCSRLQQANAPASNQCSCLQFNAPASMSSRARHGLGRNGFLWGQKARRMAGASPRRPNGQQRVIPGMIGQGAMVIEMYNAPRLNGIWRAHEAEELQRRSAGNRLAALLNGRELASSPRDKESPSLVHSVEPTAHGQTDVQCTFSPCEHHPKTQIVKVRSNGRADAQITTNILHGRTLRKQVQDMNNSNADLHGFPTHQTTDSTTLFALPCPKKHIILASTIHELRIVFVSIFYPCKRRY
ncbi:hypothetical protein E4U53_005512 [Claviceps sorghi]|nr:hypothetical protein E4U53_005512 [Claviceps sorghi]